MSFFTFMLDQWHLSLGAIFLLSSLAILIVGKRQRAAVLERLQFHRRRASAASTPPRSFSPEKKTGDTQGASLSTSNPDYVNAFPPSRRLVLPELAETASPEDSKVLLATDPDVEILVKDALPTPRAYDLQNASPKYTPTGFSTAEIKAMGDFPAYDILSGVPLPQPYENFDPTKALPRPYRPFRWAYHQTMCKSKL
jgi:hypothetical protein